MQSDQVVAFIESLGDAVGDLQRGGRLRSHGGGGCGGSHQVAPNELDLHGFPIQLHVVVPLQCSYSIDLSGIYHLCGPLAGFTTLSSVS